MDVIEQGFDHLIGGRTEHKMGQLEGATLVNRPAVFAGIERDGDSLELTRVEDG